jgi:FKBP-type peptidyl-prolyl cis-trans isomerase 2
MTIATGDAVEIEYTGRLADGTVFDTTREAVADETGLAAAQPDREYSPLVVDVGEGRVLEGLEEALVGMETGQSETITVPPEKGYGEWTDERVQTYETDQLRELLGGELPEEGAYLEAEDGTRGEITDIDDGSVHVDFNSELAGETLEFDIEVLAVE